MKYATLILFDVFFTWYYCWCVPCILCSVWSRSKCESNTCMMLLVISFTRRVMWYWDRLFYCCTPSTFARDTSECHVFPTARQSQYASDKRQRKTTGFVLQETICEISSGGARPRRPLWEMLTSRAAQLRELNLGLPSIRTFVRPNKRNDGRRGHG